MKWMQTLVQSQRNMTHTHTDTHHTHTHTNKTPEIAAVFRLGCHFSMKGTQIKCLLTLHKAFTCSIQIDQDKKSTEQAPWMGWFYCFQ